MTTTQIPNGWRLSRGWHEIAAASRLGHETDEGFTVYEDPGAAIDAHYITAATAQLSRLYVDIEDRGR